MAGLNCRICGSVEGPAVCSAREMMFGFRDEFSYFECRNCGCLRIKSVPPDLGRYYPDDYYSFAGSSVADAVRNRFSLPAWFRRARINQFLGGSGFGGRLFGRIRPLGRDLLRELEWLKICRVNPDSRILDVGCGKGDRLMLLAWHGFRNLTGLDPFLKEDIRCRNGVNIYRRSILEVTGEYDLVMFQHSLEHMPDPVSVFARLPRLLKAGGSVLVRTPNADSYAWRHYRTDWVQLDAPRHLFVYSLKGIECLAAGARLKVTRVVFDSDEMQFIGSEQYRRDIPFRDNRSYFSHSERSIFSAAQIAEFRRKAAELNAQGLGDQMCICLIGV